MAPGRISPPLSEPTLKSLPFIPTIDISVFDGSNPDAKPTKQQSEALSQIHRACLNNGFFLITGHGISKSLQQDVLQQAEVLFQQPLHEKLKVDEKKAYGKSHRGYQVIGGEAYQPGTLPDLKECYQYGRHKPLTHPDVVAQRMLSGPNQWPPALPDFPKVMNTYLEVMRLLAQRILTLLGKTLQLEGRAAEVFEKYCQDEACAVRLLHYPPQPRDAPQDQLGTGAHTDFGGITLLLTDDVPGLQVLYENVWNTVVPNTDAYIVNIGDCLHRLTAGLYASSTHRVINHTDTHRYSVPFFFDGNLDAVLEPLVDRPRQQMGGAFTVEEHMMERMSSSRSRGLKESS